MPKKRWHVLPCGVMYWFNHYSLEDVGLKIIPTMQKIEATELTKILDPRKFRKSNKEWYQKVFAMWARAILTMMVDEMMQSNRIILNDQRSPVPVRMYIGKRIITNKQHLRSVPGKFNRYGIILEGITHNYYFSMKKSRAVEMYRRIQSGQSFH